MNPTPHLLIVDDDREICALVSKFLAQHGYQGWISIEDGMNGMDEMAESLAFLRKMIATYFKG